MTDVKSIITAKIDWRERRGAATREQLLDAAVKSIVKHGYAKLSTTMVADAAKVSRGAMLHHFPSKKILIHETVKHLFEKRLTAFEKMVLNIPKGGDLVEESIKVYWQQINHPYFIAFFELTVAARTDENLLKILLPYQEALNSRGLELAGKLFPEVPRETLSLGLAMSQAVMEYLALQRIRSTQTETDKRLIEFMEQEIRSLYDITPLD